MTASAPHRSSSGERMAALIDNLDISAFQKELLRQRWLDQVQWVSRQARIARFRYLLTRVPVVIGGVAIPALITVTLSAADAPADAAGIRHLEWLPSFLDFGVLRSVTLLFSTLVAILAALDELLHYGDRWRHYRRTSESLKTLGWQYLMLNGSFRRFKSHGDAFILFTERVEELLTDDVEGFLTGVASESPEKSRHEVVA
jgi:Protein of unknown function (DUF4231)